MDILFLMSIIKKLIFMESISEFNGNTDYKKLFNNDELNILKQNKIYILKKIFNIIMNTCKCCFNNLQLIDIIKKTEICIVCNEKKKNFI